MTMESRPQAAQVMPAMPAVPAYATPVMPEKSLWPWALTLVYMSMAGGVGILGLGAYIADGMPRIREREMIIMAALLYGAASVPAVGLMLVARRLFMKLHWILQWLFMVFVFFL